jgi:hypothetical protein
MKDTTNAPLMAAAVTLSFTTVRVKLPSAGVAYSVVGVPCVPTVPAYERTDTSTTLSALHELLVITAATAVAEASDVALKVIAPAAAFTVPATMVAIVTAPLVTLTLFVWRLERLASDGIVGGTADIILLIVNILILHLINLINLIKIYF